MRNRRKIYFGVLLVGLAISSCKTPDLIKRDVNTTVPVSYKDSQDTVTSANQVWKQFFKDPHLLALIDTALHNNQELNITLQEIEVARNEIRARKGEYLPFVGLNAGAGVDKVGRYTRKGALEATTEIEPGKEFPEPLQDYLFGFHVSWELDIWKKLRNARKSAVSRYLGTVEGKNFMVTNLVAEIANSYYELLALDNQLRILQRNIEIQSNALELVRVQKQAARVTELAVKRFEAQVLNTRGRQYEIKQQIVETENRINFLVGRFSGRIDRDSQSFDSLQPVEIQTGIPSQLLGNRPDIRQAEMELAASKLDVKVARASFYPSVGISADLGIQAFNPAYLLKSPESILYSLAGDLVAPLINRNGIKADYYSANAKQLQAMFAYEQRILNAYLEVANQLSKIENLEKSYDLKNKEVQALTESTEISNKLFTSARADYMEVLLTQREALESRFDLIEIRKQQMNTMVNVYKSLGGGWR
ncbi:MAG: efflux transporter outer membrane subunit [Bacteroidetes bacterium]|nr:MAG: efflux transporter outer membrane subunit [Bacteroidota bacterium]